MFILRKLKSANKKLFAPLYINFNKFTKLFYQDKKRQHFKKRQDKKIITLVIGNNAIKSEKKRDDINQIKYYNCQKNTII